MWSRGLFSFSWAIVAILRQSVLLVTSVFFFVPVSAKIIRPERSWNFIAMSLADNNKQLLSQFKDLVSESVESLKRSNAEAELDQLREIKKVKREGSRSVNHKGSEFQ